MVGVALTPKHKREIRPGGGGVGLLEIYGYLTNWSDFASSQMSRKLKSPKLPL